MTAAPQTPCAKLQLIPPLGELFSSSTGAIMLFPTF